LRTSTYLLTTWGNGKWFRISMPFLRHLFLLLRL
jgi:hypothetical protein